jgi:hypothetical protein
MRADTFVVARNPRQTGRLKYLLRVSVRGEEPLVLAAGAEWPAVKDVFCLQMMQSWPADAAIIDEIPVSECWRAGKPVHLVLRRRTRRRSIFVWTESRTGHTLIFWRSRASMRTARPGLKVPEARGLEGPIRIAVDVRERYPWRFSGDNVEVFRRELPVGDYAVLRDNHVWAVVERKSAHDLVTSAVAGTLGFALAELSTVPHSCLVIDSRFSDVLKAAGRVQPGWLLSVVAALQVSHPRVNWVFAETRALAQEFALRWLAATLKPGATRAATRYEPAPRAAWHVAEGGQLDLPVYDRAGRLDTALSLAAEGRVWTVEEYARHFGVTAATARKHLNDMLEAGALQTRRAGRRLTYTRREA